MYLEQFAIFIMVWGRPEMENTHRALRRQGYTGKVFFIADDLDPELGRYQKKYGDDLVVYSKLEVKDRFDAGDNSGDLRTTLYSANVIKDFARELGYPYYGIFCDDYTYFRYAMNSNYYYSHQPIRDLDAVFEAIIEYYASIPALSIAIAQGGDFIGGKDNQINRSLTQRRKAMNTFICSIDRPFNFLGRMNEDVTTYVYLGNKGHLFLTYPLVAVNQPETQSVEGGLRDIYLDYGTYVKSFFTILYNPSCVRIGMIKNRRIHHRISWNNAVPYIIREDHRHTLSHI